MQLKDVGFVKTSEVIRMIERQAGLVEINFRRVHCFIVSKSGLAQKRRTKSLLEDNQLKLHGWASKPGRTEESLCLARSMYTTNAYMIQKCASHVVSIEDWLEGVQHGLTD